MSQVSHLTEVATRLETVVKLSGSTCYRAIMFKMRCGFLLGLMTRRDTCQCWLLTGYWRNNHHFLHLIWPANPGACIVTAVLQTGFANMGESEVQTALDTQISSDQDVEARLNGQTFGQFPLPIALCWQRVEESSGQPKLHRLHLVLTEAPSIIQDRSPPAHPGGNTVCHWSSVGRCP